MRECGGRGINRSLIPRDFEAIATVGDFDSKMILYLSQMFVEASAEVGEASGAVGLEFYVIANRSVCCHAFLIRRFCRRVGCQN
jgi:hypothetical protein